MEDRSMNEARKNGIRKLLEGIETGDPTAVEVIHPDTYIQHNPQTRTGRDGLPALFKRVSKTSPHVNLVRVFSDGDYEAVAPESEWKHGNGKF
ncbi:MAG: putative SnoaL-like aldol condensation-catalyzing enzyme [Myxococcota bacterium]|jgi:predicted SnoaL-like aldol condensation-catalyzing enzyme